MRKLYFIIFYFFALFPVFVIGQSVNDYRAIANGDWGASSTWQYYDGASWVSATTSPGENANAKVVTISGYNVRFNVSNQSTFKKLIIGDGLNVNSGALLVQGNYDLLAKEIEIKSGGSINWPLESTVLNLYKNVNLVINAGGALQSTSTNCTSTKSVTIGGDLYASCAGTPKTFSDVNSEGGVDYSPKLRITKEANNSYEAVGDIINYTIVVYNDGLSDLEDVKVLDPLTNFETTISLMAGQSQSFNEAYTIVQKDIDLGYVRNSASAVHGNIETSFEADYTLEFVIYPVEVILTSGGCEEGQYGYNYVIKFAYNVDYKGAVSPTVNTFNGVLACGEVNDTFNIPINEGSGYFTTYGNYWRAADDCSTVTPEAIGCSEVNITVKDNDGTYNYNVDYTDNEYFKVVKDDNIVYMGLDGNTPPEITAIGDNIHCIGGSTYIADEVHIEDDQDILEQAFIQISTNYDTGDLLTYTGSNSNISQSWSESEGRLTLTGPASLADFEDAIEEVSFSSTADLDDVVKNISIVLSELNYLASTGHYYEYVPSVGITWKEAKVAAEERTFYDVNGYLATITSEEEAILLGEQVSGAGWLGGSDEAVENEWRWVTGPEGLENNGSGRLFWKGLAGGVFTEPDKYANWNNGEPNNSNVEYYAHINAPGTGFDGSWNDLSNTGATSGAYQPKGYLVEYGWTDGTLDEFPEIAAVTTITPFVINEGNQPEDQTVFVGNNASFSVTAKNVNTYQWQESTDGGTTFSDITDAINYGGYTTASLEVLNPEIEKEGYVYRLVINNTEGGCEYVSENAKLFVRVQTVITNRNKTYRVNKN